MTKGFTLQGEMTTMETVTKKDLVAKVASMTGQSETLAYKQVECVLDHIASALQAGNRIELRGFGVFSVRDTKPRKARDPRNGASIQLPAGRKVVFKSSLDMKKPAD